MSFSSLNCTKCVSPRGICFRSLERRFFVLEYRKRHFLVYIAQRKKLEKLTFLDQNHGFCFELLVFIAQKGVFFVLEYRKRHFPGLYCLKKEIKTNGHFGTKPFGKILIFRLFEILVFIAQKDVFSFQNIVKKHFPGLHFLNNKSLKNGHF